MSFSGVAQGPTARRGPERPRPELRGPPGPGLQSEDEDAHRRGRGYVAGAGRGRKERGWQRNFPPLNCPQPQGAPAHCSTLRRGQPWHCRQAAFQRVRPAAADPARAGGPMASRGASEEGCEALEAPRLQGLPGGLEAGAAPAIAGEPRPRADSPRAWPQRRVAGGREGGRGEAWVSPVDVEVAWRPEAPPGGEGAASGEEVVALGMWEVMEGARVETQDPRQQEHSRAPGRRKLSSKRRPKMERLEVLQLELSFVNARARGALERLKRKVAQSRRLVFARRSDVIRGIPGFWATALVHQPQLSAIISPQDEDLLGYLLSLEVEELSHPQALGRIIFFFRDNPYFQNDVLIKEYVLSIAGYEACCSTTIQPLWGCQGAGPSCFQASEGLTFFNWLCARNCPGSNRIAEVIIEDLWLKPLHYYLGRTTPPREGMEGEPGVPMNPSHPDDQGESPGFA